MFAARALALLQASAFCLALPHANISLAARRLQVVWDFLLPEASLSPLPPHPFQGWHRPS